VIGEDFPGPGEDFRARGEDLCPADEDFRGPDVDFGSAPLLLNNFGLSETFRQKSA
jgi:hypothetical protein